MKIKLIVAAHKKYRMPEGELYFPLQVGAAGKDDLGYARDDTGDNISAWNPTYCELTGLYWMWKNMDADYLGLVHYRRLFVNPGFFRKKAPYSRLLDNAHAESLLQGREGALPKKRNYFIETIYSHYAHTHYAEHLDTVRKILSERCPEYLSAFDRLMHGTKAHMFNMMILRRDKLDSYCSWLFPILRELTQRVDASDYDDFQARYPGRVSELLLNVWVETQKLDYVEIPVVMIGSVNWKQKIFAFLRAKFCGARYKGSF